MSRSFQRDTVEDEVANESRLRLTLHQIGIDLKEAQDMAMAMGLHEKYGVLQGNSFARFLQVYMRSSNIPMTEKNLPRLAEVRGRMDEILTNRSAGVKLRPIKASDRQLPISIISSLFIIPLIIF